MAVEGGGSCGLRGTGSADRAAGRRTPGTGHAERAVAPGRPAEPAGPSGLRGSLRGPGGRGRTALAAGERDRSRRLFEEALGLWRGPAFAGIADLPALGPEATRLDELRLGVIEERIDVDLGLGRHSELLGELTALTMEHPFRERIWAQLMLALYRCGRRADALQAYLQVREVLAEEPVRSPVTPCGSCTGPSSARTPRRTVRYFDD
ncbi:AfsR/SARP family transcriptional regulator [Streptomyces anulatus]|uniref:AfsR/SARP family transcriptional regulator n=1 Tax=Streptomyces anulatus TaxID=1892 RepID=UPI00368C6DE2